MTRTTVPGLAGVRLLFPARIAAEAGRVTGQPRLFAVLPQRRIGDRLVVRPSARRGAATVCPMLPALERRNGLVLAAGLPVSAP